MKEKIMTEIGPCLSLPHHECTIKEINVMIAQLEHYLKQAMGLPPSIVFLARSVYDGFTPNDVSSYIESELMRMLADVYINCELNVDVTEYEEDDEMADDEEDNKDSHSS
uniref:Uncharacterized protein n=1 Tax=Heterosigma akashiwo TaxID=2829 RepID=A0A7S3URJ0_HETAK